jgi:hypothetical protein
MGKDQNANWCVTHPFFDIVMGTRKEYLSVQPSPPAVAEVPVEERGGEQSSPPPPAP